MYPRCGTYKPLYQEYCKEACEVWGHVACFYSLHLHHTLSSSTLSSIWEAVCTFSHFTHWVQWFSQPAGCTFHHFSLGLKPLGVSESFQNLWHPAGAAALTEHWGGSGVALFVQELCRGPGFALWKRWLINSHNLPLSMVVYIQKSLTISSQFCNYEAYDGRNKQLYFFY